MKKAYRHIIWDWNGTLLDDVELAVDVMNRLLQKRSLPLINKEGYRDIFTFPVVDYYAKLGFHFELESFEKLAGEYITGYNSEIHQFRLFDGAEEVLDSIRVSGIGQSILSASQEKELKYAVDSLNIHEFFFKIIGLNNHYAVSKVQRGKELLADLRLVPDEVLLIGDTVHDYEVSKALGCDCLLICNGHQNYQKLAGCNASIVETIYQVIDFVDKENIA